MSYISDTGLMRYFEFVLAREDFRETKPNPEPYLLALERLQMKATTVSLGKTQSAAIAAGLRCLVIPNDMTRVCNFRGDNAILPRAAAVLDALATDSLFPVRPTADDGCIER